MCFVRPLFCPLSLCKSRLLRTFSWFHRLLLPFCSPSSPPEMIYIVSFLVDFFYSEGVVNFWPLVVTFAWLKTPSSTNGISLNPRSLRHPFSTCCDNLNLIASVFLVAKARSFRIRGSVVLEMRGWKNIECQQFLFVFPQTHHHFRAFVLESIDLHPVAIRSFPCTRSFRSFKTSLSMVLAPCLANSS